MNIGGRQISPINLATILLFGGTLCVMCVVGVFLVRPGPVPGFGVPQAATALLTASTTPISLIYPTLGPEWTASPSPPPTNSPTPRPRTATPGEAQTPLPDLNGTAAASQDAHVKAEVETLRVRAQPGTAGTVLNSLPALTAMHIIGRTPDNIWLQITTSDGISGWVLAEFLDISINLAGVPVTAGAALDATPTNIPGVEARIKPEGDHLRLRQSPGTAGAVITNLPAGMALRLVGRTADNVWLQVITEDQRQGWVMSQFLDIFIDLGVLPVTGTAENAPPPSPTRSSPAGAGGAVTQIAFVPSSTPTSTNPPPTPTLPPTEPPPTATNPPPPGYDHPSDYITGVTEHTRQIYLAGQGSGNRANVFSKVGDSITVSPQFLSPLGGEQTDLRDYGYLAEVLAHFSAEWVRTNNSFGNASLAAKGGWSSWSVLSPSAANHAICLANESPLRCEYRVSRPAIALIMLGTNDVLSTSNDAYRANMERIITETLDRNIIPVLTTIPPFQRSGYEGRPAELNDIQYALAQAYDIPFWNYSAALQPLPNQGLGPDGIHPSWAPNAADFTPANLQYGNTVHNLTALQLLDILWRQEMY